MARVLPKLKGNAEQSMCGAKKRHLTKESAENTKRGLLSNNGDVVNVYQCPFCHFWHVGRPRSK